MKTYECPFWRWEKRLCVNCEGGRIEFVDEQAREDYIGRYCASVEGWEACSIAQHLERVYERKTDCSGAAGPSQ